MNITSLKLKLRSTGVFFLFLLGPGLLIGGTAGAVVRLGFWALLAFCIGACVTSFVYLFGPSPARVSRWLQGQ
jgi:hypothetical protein